MRTPSTLIIACTIGSILGAATFGLIGHKLVPPQEFGPLGAIIGAVVTGFPVGASSSFLLWLAFSSYSREESWLQNKACLISTALGLVTGALVGMPTLFERGPYLLVPAASVAGGFVAWFTATLIRRRRRASE